MHPNRILDFSGQVVAITGAAHGIGQATALAFAQAGAHVALLDIDGAAAQAAADEIRTQCGRAASRIEGLTLDVTQPDAVARTVDAVAAWHGRLDVMVNNAGIALRKPTLELSLADWNKVVDVNLTGVFLCAQAAGRHMVAAGRGCIVNTASIMGLSGGGLYPNISYQSTKGAVVNLTRALAVEWAPHQVRVNAVAPTWVRTDFIRPLLGQPDLVKRIEGMTPLGRLAEADDIVAAARAKPDGLNYGSWGQGSPGHLGALRLQSTTNTKMQHVPYKEMPQLFASVATGEVQWAMGSMASAGPMEKAGRVRFIGVAAPQASPYYSSAPGMAASNTAKEFVSNAWFALFAPKGTAKPLREKIAADVTEVLATPELTERYKVLGYNRFDIKPDDFAQYIQRETQIWGKIIDEAKLKLD